MICKAQARAHRLGQTKEVVTYRLVTRGSVEERMAQRARSKLVLDHLVGRTGGPRGSATAVKQEELDDLLRWGAREIFEGDEAEGQGQGQDKDKAAAAEDGAPGRSDAAPRGARILYDGAALEELLDRSKPAMAQVKETVEDEAGSGGAAALLNSFQVAKFVEVREEPFAADTAEDAAEALPAAPGAREDAQSFWDGLMGEKWRAQEDERKATAAAIAAAQGNGVRQRKKSINYRQYLQGSSSSGSGGSGSSAESDGTGSDYEASSGSSDDDRRFGRGEDSGSGRETGKKADRERDAEKGRGAGAAAAAVASQPAAGSAGLEGQARAAGVPGGADSLVCGFGHADRDLFLRTVMRFGLGTRATFESGAMWDQMRSKYFPDKTKEQLESYAGHFVAALNQDAAGNSPAEAAARTLVLGRHARYDILARVAAMQLATEATAKSLEVAAAAAATNAAVATQPIPLLDPSTLRVLYVRGASASWSPAHDLALLRALLQHGYGHWGEMLVDPAFGPLGDHVAAEVAVKNRVDVRAAMATAQASGYSLMHVMDPVKMKEWAKKRVQQVTDALRAQARGPSAPASEAGAGPAGDASASTAAAAAAAKGHKAVPSAQLGAGSIPGTSSHSKVTVESYLGPIQDAFRKANEANTWLAAVLTKRAETGAQSTDWGGEFRGRAEGVQASCRMAVQALQQLIKAGGFHAEPRNPGAAGPSGTTEQAASEKPAAGTLALGAQAAAGEQHPRPAGRRASSEAVVVVSDDDPEGIEAGAEAGAAGAAAPEPEAKVDSEAKPVPKPQPAKGPQVQTTLNWGVPVKKAPPAAKGGGGRGALTDADEGKPDPVAVKAPKPRAPKEILSSSSGDEGADGSGDDRSGVDSERTESGDALPAKGGKPRARPAGSGRNRSKGGGGGSKGNAPANGDAKPRHGRAAAPVEGPGDADAAEAEGRGNRAPAPLGQQERDPQVRVLYQLPVDALGIPACPAWPKYM